MAKAEAEGDRSARHTDPGARAGERRRRQRAALWDYQVICWEIELLGDRHRPRHAARPKSAEGSGGTALTGCPPAA